MSLLYNNTFLDKIRLLKLEKVHWTCQFFEYELIFTIIHNRLNYIR